MSCMAFTLSGSTSMPLLLTTNPNNLPDFTPIVHFAGFNFNCYFLNLLNNFLRARIWFSSSLDFAIMSST